MTITYTLHFNGTVMDVAGPDDLKPLSARQIVGVFNAIADEPVNRFTDRNTAIRRTWALITAKVGPNAMPECLPAPKGSALLLTLLRSAANHTVSLDDITASWTSTRARHAA